jgi:hypothetical protein
LIVKGSGSVGVSAEFGVRYHAVSTGIELHGDPPLGSSSYANGNVIFTRVSGSLLVCGHYGWFAGCGVGEVGRTFFPSHIAVLPPSTLYGAAGARVRLEFPVAPPWLFLTTALDVRAPIPPASFTYEGHSIFQVAGPSIGLGIGLLVELPR